MCGFLIVKKLEVKIGEVDNRHISGLFGLNYQNHTVSLGYMQSFGSTGLPFCRELKVRLCLIL